MIGLAGSDPTRYNGVGRPPPVFGRMQMTQSTRIIIGLAVANLLVGTAWLWSRYGDIVYFERIASSFIGCFY